MSVLSEQNRARLKGFLAEPASRYDVDTLEGVDPYSKIHAWALDPELGGLPPYAARHFANWLAGAWSDFLEPEHPDAPVKDVLDGAMSDWTGGRVMPS